MSHLHQCSNALNAPVRMFFKCTLSLCVYINSKNIQKIRTKNEPMLNLSVDIELKNDPIFGIKVFFRIYNSDFKQLSTACYQVQIQVSLINIHWKEFKNVDFGSKCSFYSHFEHTENFPQKEKNPGNFHEVQWEL